MMNYYGTGAGYAGNLVNVRISGKREQARNPVYPLRLTWPSTAARRRLGDIDGIGARKGLFETLLEGVIEVLLLLDLFRRRSGVRLASWRPLLQTIWLCIQPC